METQDHKRLNHSGSGEHGAVHVCNKCGWPFPNAHPSSRHRRAHKRVCGTVEGYRLDHVSQDKEASDGEHNSDDEFKTPSDKTIERTISRRSSSGVGSRSSRSTRSEDDTFTDAVTEFNESPATVVEETQISHDGLQRFYSMQSELDDIKPAEVGSNNDDVYAPHILKDKLPTVPTLEVEKGIEDVASQDYTFISPSSVPAVVTLENEDALDQNMKQSSQLSNELDIVSESDIEIMLSKNSELRGSYSGTPENVAGDISFTYGGNDEPKATSDEILDSVSVGGLVKPTLNVSDGAQDDTEKLNDIDSPGEPEIEGRNDIGSLRNFPSPVLQVAASGDGNPSKSEMIDEGDYKIGTTDNPRVLAAPDASILQGHEEVAAEDLDQTGRLNTCKSPDTTVARAEYIEPCTAEEGGSDTTSAGISGSDRIVSDNMVHKNTVDTSERDDEQKSAAEQKTSEDNTNVLDPKVSGSDTNLFRSEEAIQDLDTENLGPKNDSFEQKPTASSENVFPEGAITSHIEDTFSTVDVIPGSNLENDSDHVNTCENEGTKILEDDSAVSISVLTKSANAEVPLQAEGVISTHQSNGMGDDESVRVKDTVLGGKEPRSGGELEKESTKAEAGSNGLISHDSIDESTNADHSQVNMILNYGDVMAGHSLGDSVLTSQRVGEIQSSCENEFHDERIADSGTTNIFKTEHNVDLTLKVEKIEDVEPFRQSSAAVDHISSEKFAESTSGDTQDGRVTKQPVAMSAVDTIVDSSSQTDSVDGNWGSASVKSAASDAHHASDSLASYNSQEKGTSLELKPVLENEISQNQTSIRPEIVNEQIEYASEIQTTNEEQQINSALQTGRAPAVSHVENEAHKGKKEKEIIAKVTNWDSGKQHTPLKTLLGEATAKSRAESPIHYSQSSTSVPQTDDIAVTNNGFSAKSVNVVPSSSKPEMEADQEEMGKEWNSPARYPVNIKSEKRKGRGKPLWAPFLCCSSINAR